MDPVVHRRHGEPPPVPGRRQMLEDLSQSGIPLGEQLYSVLRWLAANKYVKKTDLEGWLGILQGHLADAKRVQLKLKSDLTLDDTDIKVAGSAATYFTGQVSLVKHKLIASIKADSRAQGGLEVPNLAGFTVKALLDVASFCMREDVCDGSESRGRLASYCATSGHLAIPPQGDSNPNLNTELRTILTEMVTKLP